MEKVKIKEIVPDDRYGIMGLGVGEIIENRCKPSDRDYNSQKIRSAIQYYSKLHGRKFKTKKTALGIAITREA